MEDLTVSKVLNTSLGGFTVGHILSAILTLLVCLVVVRLVMKLVTRLLGRAQKLNERLQKIIRTAVKAVLYLLTAIITAGALGNIFDCFFYGLVFSESTLYAPAVFGGHYAPFLFGKVVDMFYFPIIDTTWPDWMPWLGGRPFKFFEPVFNFADSCVTVGTFYLIFFQYKFFAQDGKVENAQPEATPTKHSEGRKCKK